MARMWCTGCFFYGNEMPTADAQAEAALFAKLVSANTRWLDFHSSLWFDARSGVGSARSAVHSLTGLPAVYTLECNCTSPGLAPSFR